MGDEVKKSPLEARAAVLAVMAATAALGLTFGASLLIHGQTHAIM